MEVSNYRGFSRLQISVSNLKAFLSFRGYQVTSNGGGRHVLPAEQRPPFAGWVLTKVLSAGRHVQLSHIETAETRSISDTDPLNDTETR